MLVSKIDHFILSLSFWRCSCHHPTWDLPPCLAGENTWDPLPGLVCMKGTCWSHSSESNWRQGLPKAGSSLQARSRGAKRNQLHLMDERSRDGRGVLRPSSMMDCRSPALITRLSSAQRRMPRSVPLSPYPLVQYSLGPPGLFFFQGVWVLDSCTCELPAEARGSFSGLLFLGIDFRTGISIASLIAFCF